MAWAARLVPLGRAQDVPDTSAVTPDSRLIEQDRRDIVLKALSSLTFREREIIKLRYGLGDGYTYTWADIGRVFNVTSERARQIGAKAIRKLQHPSRQQMVLEELSEGR